MTDGPGNADMRIMKPSVFLVSKGRIEEFPGKLRPGVSVGDVVVYRDCSFPTSMSRNFIVARIVNETIPSFISIGYKLETETISMFPADSIEEIALELGIRGIGEDFYFLGVVPDFCHLWKFQILKPNNIACPESGNGFFG